MLKRMILGTSLALLFSPAFTADAPARPVDAAGWSALALSDLAALHDLLRDHTPIPFDKENPAYARWLEEGLEVARSRAAQVRDETSFVFALTGYANGFHDPHIKVDAATPSASRWPGFIAAKRGDAVIVAQRDLLDSSAPAPGTVIESCDGETPAQLVQSRVLQFMLYTGAPERVAATELFLDHGNPFAPLPARCVMRSGDNVTEVTLRWRGIQQRSINSTDDFNNAAAGGSAAWGLAEPVPGVFWVGIPTFFQTDDTASELRQLMKDIKRRGDEMRGARAIVIDTRGNAGGVGYWGGELSDAIFTPKVLKSAGVEDFGGDIAVEERASPENSAEHRAAAERLAGERTAAQRRGSKSNLATLDRAIKRNRPLVRFGKKKVGPSGGITEKRPRNKASPFPAQVYLLSNGTCMSVCLMFADQALMVPGVQLIGTATGSDTPYSAVRSETLPSGLAMLTLPQAVYRGRGRGALEAYQPDIAYGGSWDDASVRAWVLALIESDPQ